MNNVGQKNEGLVYVCSVITVAVLISSSHPWYYYLQPYAVLKSLWHLLARTYFLFKDFFAVDKT